MQCSGWEIHALSRCDYLVECIDSIVFESTNCKLIMMYFGNVSNRIQLEGVVFHIKISNHSIVCLCAVMAQTFANRLGVLLDFGWLGARDVVKTYIDLMDKMREDKKFTNLKSIDTLFSGGCLVRGVNKICKLFLQRLHTK